MNKPHNFSEYLGFYKTVMEFVKCQCFKYIGCYSINAKKSSVDLTALKILKMESCSASYLF